ncbi:NUDIX domain-containing protein [Patescibacteria group bacterium]|nr:NUDIX domain-containing protein [Patescibacteria group bacterium]
MQNEVKIFEEKIIWNKKEFFCEYIDGLDFSNIKPITQVQALCFLPNRTFVIFEDINGNYGLPGGSIETGESLEKALFRELQEEAAVQPIKYGPLLYLRITNLSKKPLAITYQVRYWALVKLLNEKVSDPVGKAMRRRIVKEKELLKLVKWGKKLKIYLEQMKKLRTQQIVSTKY